MNLRLLLALACGAMLTGWIAVPAFAHHSENQAAAPPVCASQVGADGAVTDSDLSLDSSARRANVTFTIAEGCKDIKLTLVSYTATSPTFDVNTAAGEVVFDYKTQLFSAGTWHLDVAYNPDCYYEADFVYGERIVKFGPADSDNFYYRQGRNIRAFHDGPKACTETTPTPPTTTPPPTTQTPPPNTPTPVVTVTPAVVPPPSVSLVKTERVGSAGGFVRGPVRGKVGKRIFYRLTVTNPGTATVSVTVKDPGCDTGTLKPVGAVVLNAGASFTFTCSHLLKARDGSQYVNVAVATATATDGAQATATSRVVATVVTGEVLGTQKTVTKKAKPKPKVKKVTKKAKPAKPVVVGASFTG